MTEKQDETCQNCGHVKSWHTWRGDCAFNITDMNNAFCSCKKFVGKKPKVKSLHPGVFKDALSKKPKGCGKDVKVTLDETYSCGTNYFGEIVLCPSCKKPKNHSPVGKGDVSKPTSASPPLDAKEGTFNLSKKRELQYIGTIDKDRWIYPEEYVKEFISRERGVIDDWVAKLRRNEEGTKIIMVSDLLDLTGRLNKLAGDLSK